MIDNAFLWEELAMCFALANVMGIRVLSRRLNYLYMFPPMFLLFNFAKRTMFPSLKLLLSLNPRIKKIPGAELKLARNKSLL